MRASGASGQLAEVACLAELARELGWQAQAAGRAEIAQVHWSWMRRLQTLMPDTPTPRGAAT